MLYEPHRGLQILDTRMGFPRPSPNVVLDSISLEAEDTIRLQSNSLFLLPNG